MDSNLRILVLKEMDYRESDKIITLFSETEGKFTALARGVKKPKSSLRGCLQPFCLSELQVKKGKGDLGIISQGRIIDFYGNSREDIYRTMISVYILELLDKSLPERHPEADIFRLSVSVLSLIDQLPFNDLWLRFFEVSIIRMLGITPEMTNCVCCGASCDKDARRSFSLEQGGLLCRTCSGDDASAVACGGEAIALLKTLSNWPASRLAQLDRVKASSNARYELESLIEKYLEFHLEKRLNVKRNIRLLQGS